MPLSIDRLKELCEQTANQFTVTRSNVVAMEKQLEEERAAVLRLDGRYQAYHAMLTEAMNDASGVGQVGPQEVPTSGGMTDFPQAVGVLQFPTEGQTDDQGTAPSD